jgi:glycosyltransferase involved in cell wall biosynthesis
MKIVVLNNAAPFVRGGAEALADKLTVELSRAGHQAELVRMPFGWSTPDEVVESMLSVAGMRVRNCDRVIALKFPVYLVPHEDVVVWLIHQFRQVYDLWDSPGGWPDEPRHHEVRERIWQADRVALSRAAALHCISPVVQQRLHDHLGLHADVLHHPLPHDDQFTSGPYGDYILALGRLSGGKRQELAVRAMAHVPRSSGRLIVVGPPDSASDAIHLKTVVSDLHLEERVEIIDHFVSETEKRRLLAGARAVAYLPVDEDSYGYVTLEAASASRPVVTLSDSGGVLALVEHGRTGLVSQPDAEALAEVFDRLLRDAGLAASLGSTMREKAEALELTWKHVVERLTA